MHKDILFDCIGVLYTPDRNQLLIDYIQQLRQKYKVFLFSNLSPSSLQRYFDTSEQKQLFDAVFAIGGSGVLKPDTQAYSDVCEDLLIAADQAVMIDDSSDNCVAARRFGMAAVKYESFEQTRRDLSAVLEQGA